MTESSAWQTLRTHLKRPRTHIQRLEDSLTAGIPDASVCHDGREIWLEGKYMKALPKRIQTPIKPGLRPDQATWLENRERAGGNCRIWIRIVDLGWVLVWTDFRRCVDGFTREDLDKNDFATLYPTAKAMAGAILNGTHY